MQVKIDTTKAPIDSWYVKSVGSEHHIVYEYDNERIDLIIPDEQFNKVNDLVLKECGNKTYSELEDENIKLEAQVEERNNLIEQYEEHNDARMEKYFNSDCIL